MIKKQRINLKTFTEEAKIAGCKVIRNSRSRCCAADATGIAVVTTTGAIQIPLDQIGSLMREIRMAADITCGMWDELSLAEKNRIARDRGMDYGKMQQAVYEVRLGGKHEQENG